MIKLGTMRDDIDDLRVDVRSLQQDLDGLPRTQRKFAVVENGFISYFFIAADRGGEGA